jgi:hypothetical protein
LLSRQGPAASVAVVTVDTGAVELQAAAVTCYVKAAHDPQAGMKIVRKKKKSYMAGVSVTGPEQ